MRLKTVALSLLALLAVGLAFADNFSGPAGRFISVGGSIDLLGDVNTSGKANGNCLVYNASTGKWVPGVCGSGGGSSSLSVNSGGVQISSPTQTLNFSSNTFIVAQGPVGTSTVTINFSSITAKGNAFNSANQLLQLDGTGKIPNSLLSASVSLFGDAVDLPTQTNGEYVASASAGPGINVNPSAPGHGTEPIFSLSPGTLTGDQSWADGAANSVTWRWVVPGVAPRFTFSDNLIETLSELDAPAFVGTTMSADTISAGLAMTSGGKNVAQYSDTVIAGSTVAYSSGTIQNVNVTTITFHDGTTMITAATGGPGGFWVGKATSSLDMNGFAVTGSTLVAASSFSVTGATETIFGTTYVRASSTTVGSGQKLLVYTAANGKMTESIQDIITNGMTTTSTDTKSGALIMQSSFTLPSVSQMGNPASAGQMAYSTSTAGASWGGLVLFDGLQRMNAVMVATTSTPSNSWVPTWDSSTGKILWEAQSVSGGAGTPGGSNTQIQFNNAGSFNGVAVATYNATTQLLTFSSGVTHVNVSSETFNNVRLVMSGTSAIQWANGTIQTSSPTAAGGGGVAQDFDLKDGTGTLNLSNQVTGNLGVSNLGSGTNANALRSFFGDAAWRDGPIAAGISGASFVGETIPWNLYHRFNFSGARTQNTARLSDEVVGTNGGSSAPYADLLLWATEVNGPTLVPTVRLRADVSSGTEHVDDVVIGRGNFDDGTNHTHNVQLQFRADSSTATLAFGAQFGADRLYTDMALQASTFYGDGSHLSGITGSGGASTLAVTTGSTTGFSVVTTSPTAVVNFSSDTFKVSLTGSSTAFVTLNPSSVTLLGSTIPLGTNTSGNYVANANTNASMTGGTAGSAGASLTFGVDPASGTLQGNTFNAASKLVQLNSSTQYPALDGGLILKISSISASGVTTGSYGTASNVSSFTVSGDGRITGAANVAILITPTQAGLGNVTNTAQINNQSTLQNGSTGYPDFLYVGTSETVHGAFKADGQITSSNTVITTAAGLLDATKLAGNLPATVQASSFPAIVAAGSYGSTTIIPTITINAQGQVVALSSNTAAAGAAQDFDLKDSTGAFNRLVDHSTNPIVNVSSISFSGTYDSGGKSWAVRPSTFSHVPGGSAGSITFTGASSHTVEGMQFWAVANSTFTGRFVLSLNNSSSNSVGYKFLMTGPASPVFFTMTGGGSGSSATTVNLSQQAAALATKTGTFIGTYASNPAWFEFEFTLITGATPGYVNVQIVPASGAGNNFINSESYITAVMD